MKKVDTQEFDLPETLFVRDIDNKVFQGIVYQCLSKIDGISLVEGNFINNILALEGIRGVQAEQDNKHQCVSITIEVNIGFGVSIPAKAEEIQSKVTEEITRMTGLHVSMVHVIFKGITQLKKGSQPPVEPVVLPAEEYNDEF